MDLDQRLHHGIAALARRVPKGSALAALLFFFVLAPAAAQTGKPSRPASKGCAWEKIADAQAGLAAWVQRCDYGFRRIDFLFKDRALSQRFSDGGDPYPVVEAFEQQPGESPQAAMKRVFLAHTDPALAARCMLVPYHAHRTPAGARHYTFEPKPDYRRELRKKESPDEVGDPPCGDWGIAPDGIQYFEARPGGKARRIFFVRVGQDEPLFDEMTLQPLLP